MAAVDRFLTLMRVVTGCVALECGGEEEEEEEEEEEGNDGTECDSDDGWDEDSAGSCDGCDGTRVEEKGGALMGEEDAARLLVAAHLIRCRGFDAAEAVAWARMAHPAAPRAGPELVLVRGGLAVVGRAA